MPTCLARSVLTLRLFQQSIRTLLCHLATASVRFSPCELAFANFRFSWPGSLLLVTLDSIAFISPRLSFALLAYPLLNHPDTLRLFRHLRNPVRFAFSHLRSVNLHFCASLFFWSPRAHLCMPWTHLWVTRTTPLTSWIASLQGICIRRFRALDSALASSASRARP